MLKILKRFARALLRLWPTILIYRMCVRWPVLADVFYLFRPYYRREHRGTLYGKLLHMESASSTERGAACYALRRGIHRIEKGLIMRPRRNVFGLDYIADAVRIFESLVNHRDLCNESEVLLLGWSNDVLSMYFETGGNHSLLDKLRPRFNKASTTLAMPEAGRAPYNRDLSPLSISYEEMLALAKRRRSVRWYLPQPVPRAVIDNAINVALYSPSACNRQPFEFRIYDDPDMIRKVAAIPMGTKGFAENFPCVAVVVGELRAYFFERDRHVIYIDAALAVMAFQFALEVQGVSTCCINFPDIDEREEAMRRALGLAPDQRPIMCISIGYPDPEGKVPFSQKKSLEEMRIYNRPVN